MKSINSNKLLIKHTGTCKWLANNTVADKMENIVESNLIFIITNLFFHETA
jgi:hypothetical protein